MNYNDWVKAFRERTPLQLAGIISAIDTLEKDVDIRQEFGGLGLFWGFSLRSAAREALGLKEEQRINELAKTVHTTIIYKIVDEFPQVDSSKITRPITLSEITNRIRSLLAMSYKDISIDKIPTVATIIDAVSNDVSAYYPELELRYIDELSDPHTSVLSEDSYYEIMDDVAKMLTDSFGGN